MVEKTRRRRGDIRYDEELQKDLDVLMDSGMFSSFTELVCFVLRDWIDEYKGDELLAEKAIQALDPKVRAYRVRRRELKKKGKRRGAR